MTTKTKQHTCSVCDACDRDARARAQQLCNERWDEQLQRCAQHECAICDYDDSDEARVELMDDASADERCATIARELLGFDPRESRGPELRAVDAKLLQAALVVAYRAGRASERGAK